MPAQPDSSSSSPFSSVDNAATKSNAIEIPSITLPKGGGALKSIDEKFSVNAANGTSAFSVPLPLSPSRGGFQPSLSLAYNSGSGNGIFGLGWSVAFPGIKRKTDRKLPLYRDAEESDVFLFSESEDLVPVLNSLGRIEELIAGNFRITSYRPRIEGLFARIEKISLVDSVQVYWKATTRENAVTFFGITSEYRISDPGNSKKIFEWLPELSFDDKGNCIVFTYKQEDTANVPASLCEQYRLNGTAPFANRYIKRIRYGNKIPFYPAYVTDPDNVTAIYAPLAGQVMPTEFMFELVFDYGEHAEYSDEETKAWSCRRDPFSNYKAGFEIRTYRICERIMMFHDFVELNAGMKTMVRSIDVTYEQPDDRDAPVEVTYLRSINQRGYVFRPDGTFYSESLPPLGFDYQRLKWNKQVRRIAENDLVHAPVGLTENYQWADLYNEGISGILSEQAEGWYYKGNQGNSQFAIAELVSPKPSVSGLSAGTLQLMDVDGDGRKQVVSRLPSMPGYFELTDGQEWGRFRPFDEMPDIDFKDPNSRMIDLDGDGKPDLLITEEYAFRWYVNEGSAGYGMAQSALQSYDEEKGPLIIFTDKGESIYQADMSGDGMPDIVRISSTGSICYWPNLGYGCFGAKVNMGSIGITDAFSFNPDYLQLADITGTGSTDIVYTGNNKWQVWINRSGNSFSKPFEIDPFWQAASPAKISVVDLLGKGTGCIVWSSPLPGDRNMAMQYIDLMDGQKPHLMIRCTNGMGKTNSVEYRSSVTYYLEDKKMGKPWVTRLPFPVHCVCKLTVRDEVTDLQFTTSYSYHHGYYDHAEREFRGFGRVDQVDTEEYEELKGSGASNATGKTLHEPPVLIRTWYHTGAFTQRKKILDHFETEYWYNDASFAPGSIVEHRLSDAEIPGGLSPNESRQAFRCCKGTVLRTEVFALDKSDKEKIPFKVIINNCVVRLWQAQADNAHAVFTVQQSESVTLDYERSVADPRVSHSLNLEIDEFGNILKNMMVNYGREEMAADQAVDLLDASLWRHRDFIKRGQVQEHLVYTETKVTKDAKEKTAGKELHYYRLPVAWSVKTFECRGFHKGSHVEAGILVPNRYFSSNDFGAVLTGTGIDYKGYHEVLDSTSASLQLRLIEQAETLMLSYDLNNALASGMHGATGLTYESYQLAFTPELLDKIYNADAQGTTIAPAKVSETEMFSARYCHIPYNPADVNWWIRSGQIRYLDAGLNEPHSFAENRFYSAIGYIDPFGAITNASYAANRYFLFVEKITDALNNSSGIVDFNYRVLSPGKIYDCNDNLSEVAFSAAGVVTGTAVMGKGNQADNLAAFSSDLSANETDAFFNDPILNGRNLLGDATARMIYDFKTLPVKVATISRETHVLKEDGTANPESNLRYVFEYTDGFGNLVLTKMQAAKGLAREFGNGVLIEIEADPRWLGDGRVIQNNKGKPVKKYEPYFSAAHLYESEAALREYGVTPLLHYDSAGRLVRTDYPDGSISRVEYDNWQQKTFDQNDTLNDDGCRWRLERDNIDIEFLGKLAIYNGDADKEKEALEKSRVHAQTPSVALLDSRGKLFYVIEHNKWQLNNIGGPQPPPGEIFSATRTEIDVEGNILEVIDGRDIPVIKYQYNLLGHASAQISSESGMRRILNDCMGRFALAWDGKEQRFEVEYDVMHRPLYCKVVKENVAVVYEKIEYGTDKLNNLNTVAIRRYDSAGVESILHRDIDGNVTAITRVLCNQTSEIPDWNDLSDEIFLNTTNFDALGRVVEMTSPHLINTVPSVHRLVYNETGLLRAITISLQGGPEKYCVNNIDYNAKGQRTSMAYGNNVFTKYEYDPETFRLRTLLTSSDTARFGNDSELKKTSYQCLRYTYDAVGNIINIEDEAQQTHFFDNALIKPENNYQYDALYRLIEAKGREHIGQNLSVNAYDGSRIFKSGIPSSDNALRNYTQRYAYDLSGNMTQMTHLVRNVANATGWTRNFNYSVDSNQLLSSRVGNNTVQYTYDVHGNMDRLAHLPSISWNYRDQLHRLQIQAATDNDNADSASYLYDSSGQRMRKVVRKGNIMEERIYINGFELFRKSLNGRITFESETLHIHDESNKIASIERLTIDNGNTLTIPEDLIRYQCPNHLGSACLELNDNGQVISYEEFHPFGSTAYQNQNSNIKAAAKRYRYTGMERDEESGLEYHGSRFYAPWICRWINCDPIGIKGGLNVYTYVENQPVNRNDQTGTKGVERADFSDEEALVTEVHDDSGSKTEETSPPPEEYNFEDDEIVADNIQDKSVDELNEAVKTASELRASDTDAKQRENHWQYQLSIAREMTRRQHIFGFKVLGLEAAIIAAGVAGFFAVEAMSATYLVGWIKGSSAVTSGVLAAGQTAWINLFHGVDRPETIALSFAYGYLGQKMVSGLHGGSGAFPWETLPAGLSFAQKLTFTGLNLRTFAVAQIVWLAYGQFLSQVSAYVKGTAASGESKASNYNQLATGSRALFFNILLSTPYGKTLFPEGLDDPKYKLINSVIIGNVQAVSIPILTDTVPKNTGQKK